MPGDSRSQADPREWKPGDGYPLPPIEGRVVAAFPATGKSYIVKHDLRFADSDSSRFSKHPDWPQNYIDHIKSELLDGVPVLVSTHAEVREALVDAGMHFTLVYPNRWCKHEYIKRMVDRGSPEALIAAVADHWHEWIDSCERQEGCDHVVLERGEYLSDVLGLSHVS